MNNTGFAIKDILAPTNFSIQENPKRTLGYFKRLINIIERGKCDKVVFNMSNIKQVTIDAVTYLISLVHSIEVSKEIICSGNFPKQGSEPERVLKESGYMEVQGYPTPCIKPRRGPGFMIRMGEKVDPETLKSVLKFLQSGLNMNESSVSFLYELIGELMQNTIDHAYNGYTSGQLQKKWYLYIQLKGSKASFIFLDDGAGIPATINRTTSEKFLDVIFPLRRVTGQASDYIFSAMNGRGRSATKSLTRNKGLPQVYNYYKKGQISNMEIFSNKGRCLLTEDSYNKLYNRHVLHFPLRGTMFCWEFDKSNYKEAAG